MRAARAHASYVVGVALVATAVIAPLPRGVRALLVIAGLLLLVTDGLLSMRRAVEGPITQGPRGSSDALGTPPPYRHALGVASIVIGVLGAGYVWAASLGDGLHGLQSTAALDRSGSFPDANVAVLAALVAFAAGPFGVVFAGYVRPNRLLHCFAGCAGAGGVVFGLTRLFM